MRFPRGACAAVALATTNFNLIHQPSAPFAHGFSMKMSTATKPPPPIKTGGSSSGSSSGSGSDAPSGGPSNDQQQPPHPLHPLSSSFDHSWLNQLNPEPPASRLKSSSFSQHDESSDRFNKSKRPVFSGHYVEVKPTPLKNPRLVVHSPDMARRLQLIEEAVRSEEFTKFFSGDVDGALEHVGSGSKKTWATPYALSIMGTRYTSNCPFGTGDGYGDGRAISIGEVTVPPEFADSPASPRYEMQLKGAGPTPFCRGADGRAVLRSSIREFLASEAMHFLGVPTTRALSLIVSDGPNGDTSMRPWYSEGNKRVIPKMDDPRLSRYSDAQKRQILSQIAVQSRDNPDVMIEEPCAITCRVAPSFVRVGHVDLFARRATKELQEAESVIAGKSKQEVYESLASDENSAVAALEKMVWHAAYREFPQAAYYPHQPPNKPTSNIGAAAQTLLRNSMEGISSVVADWVRVGFTQGNFNADNCLVGGRTMDYGPFGFVDEYHPLYAKWTGSGEHFGFLNQPQAGFTNFAVLVESVLPVIYGRLGEEEGGKFREEIMGEGSRVFQNKVEEVFRRKMGFHPVDDAADELWEEVEPLLRECRADWTLFWRQLTEVAGRFPVTANKTGGESTSDDDADDAKEPNYGDMLEVLVGSDDVREGSSPFHQKLDAEYRAKFLKWIQRWWEALEESYKEGEGTSALNAAADAAAAAEGGGNGDSSTTIETAEERMRLSNPKYVLREWTLVEAYNRAAGGDESMVQELLDLVTHPYDEGTDEQIEKYYRRAPDEALRAGGTAYMS